MCHIVYFTFLHVWRTNIHFTCYCCSDTQYQEKGLFSFFRAELTPLTQTLIDHELITQRSSNCVITSQTRSVLEVAYTLFFLICKILWLNPEKNIFFNENIYLYYNDHYNSMNFEYLNSKWCLYHDIIMIWWYLLLYVSAIIDFASLNKTGDYTR